MSFAATALSQSALNSAQVFGNSVMPACSIAFVDAQIQFMRWMFIGAATQLPVGFITSKQFGRDDLVPALGLGELVEIGVMPVSFHSAISGPLS